LFQKFFQGGAKAKKMFTLGDQDKFLDFIAFLIFLRFLNRIYYAVGVFKF
jgi:hypothetical protein